MSGKAIRANQLQPSRPADLPPSLDGQIVVIFCILALLGLVMVTSASIAVADGQLDDPFYYGKRQLLRLILGATLMWLAYRVPTHIWRKHGMLLMLSSILLLALILIPGVGRTVNGAMPTVSAVPYFAAGYSVDVTD